LAPVFTSFFSVALVIFGFDFLTTMITPYKRFLSLVMKNLRSVFQMGADFFALS